MQFGKLFKISGDSQNDDRVVGIDIGSSSIKVIELQQKDKQISLTTYGELQLGPYANKEIGQSVTLDQKSEQQALVDVVRESAVKAKNAVFSMPLSSSFVTIIDVEADSVEDIPSRVRVEARKYIPVPISEVTLDWALLSTEEKNKEEKNKFKVLLAAIQNQSLSRFNILMQFANLEKPPIEIECFSAIRGIYDEENSNIAIIDIGAVSTKLYLVKDGLLQRMHRVRAGGVIATKRIASVLELSFDEAETKKRNTKKTDSDFREIAKLHDLSYERTWQEFRQVIAEHENIFGVQLNKVYLTGGGAVFPTTKNMLKEALKKDVAIVDTFNKVSYPAFMEDFISELNPIFHVSLGAALRMFE